MDICTAIFLGCFCLQLDAFSNPKLSAQVKVLQRQLEETKTQIGKDLLPNSVDNTFVNFMLEHICIHVVL